MSSAEGDGVGVFQSGDNHSLKELPTERQVVPAASLAQTQLVSGPIPLWNLKRPSMDGDTWQRQSPSLLLEHRAGGILSILRMIMVINVANYEHQVERKERETRRRDPVDDSE